MTESLPERPDPEQALVRAIGPWALGANGVNLTIGAGIFAHITQGLRVELARLEEQRLDALGCVGFVSFDPETMQIVYVDRR